jgi:hypothetical protein
LALRVTSISSLLADPFLAAASFAIDSIVFALVEALVVRCMSDIEVGLLKTQRRKEVDGQPLFLARRVSDFFAEALVTETPLW